VTRYLLDTNVVSELLKVKPHGAVIAWVTGLRPEQIFIPAVTMAELQTGVELTRQHDTHKAQEIQRWLDSLAVTFSFVPMDAACFQEWARMMTGKPDALRADAMIAATARVHGFEVATRDEADFRQFDVRIINPFKS
jgi:predicted nucleic acid-binding protein